MRNCNLAPGTSYAQEKSENCALAKSEGLTILTGQLTLFRKRYEQNIPVGADSISRAEDLARQLEVAESQQ